MAKSESHKKAQQKAAGEGGKTEVNLKGGKRLDALTKNRIKATEVERGGTEKSLTAAVKRLKISRAQQKVLQVPQKDMQKAAEAMKNQNVRGTIKNMGGTKRRSV